MIIPSLRHACHCPTARSERQEERNCNQTFSSSHFLPDIDGSITLILHHCSCSCFYFLLLPVPHYPKPDTLLAPPPPQCPPIPWIGEGGGDCCWSQEWRHISIRVFEAGRWGRAARLASRHSFQSLMSAGIAAQYQPVPTFHCQRSSQCMNKTCHRSLNQIRTESSADRLLKKRSFYCG